MLCGYNNLSYCIKNDQNIRVVNLINIFVLIYSLKLWKCILALVEYFEKTIII
jgi:hypothetical protein